MDFPSDSEVKNIPANAVNTRNVGLILGKEDPGGGQGNPLQYSCMENSRIQRVDTNEVTEHADTYMCIFALCILEVSLQYSYKDIIAVILYHNCSF